MKIASRPRVILRRCSTYDVEKIRSIVRSGLEELSLRPRGRTLIKPNVVASGAHFPHAYTRPEFIEGVIGALRDRDDGRVTELAVGERCGITLPTRMTYEGAGYYPMFRRTGVKHYHFEEEQQVEIRLTHEGRLRDYLFTPEPVAKADFFVNCPKFKSHPWTTVTFSMKNYIGIQDDRHRLIDHDHRLNEKVADLQYIVQPQFIAIDAITAGEGRMLTPTPFDLGLIIMGNNQVAFDSVCSQIIGVDPRSVDHIRLASERGFGPMDLGEIEITGDVTLEEAKQKAKGFKVGLVRVEKYFEGTNITAYAGTPPEPEHTDYCWGGCPGAIEEAIEILREYDKECDAKMPRMHVVFGAYEGPIDAKPGEKVVFIGDCATYKGKIGDQLISIDSLYRERSARDPYTAKHDDVLAKMVKVTTKLAKARNESVIRLEGCPVSVAEQVLTLVTLGKTKNPYFAADQVLEFNKAYVAWRGASLAKRLAGKPYQVHGACSRGEAAPELPAEPPTPPAAE
ncbi:FeS-binding protein [Sorangium cellulosum]|uniref:FeS-binding protein n=1 Tax=Sorangium cellulosum TaxID=56 RepID=A0A150T7D7_SORCE|nr:FeS-binding protein [Sorangium cellulosum]KYG00772.1 FeS-binding protein [Sorangium cellulosum]